MIFYFPKAIRRPSGGDLDLMFNSDEESIKLSVYPVEDRKLQRKFLYLELVVQSDDLDLQLGQRVKLFSVRKDQSVYLTKNYHVVVGRYCVKVHTVSDYEEKQTTFTW